jgi:hypothetical protein
VFYSCEHCSARSMEKQEGAQCTPTFFSGGRYVPPSFRETSLNERWSMQIIVNSNGEHTASGEVVSGRKSVSWREQQAMLLTKG